MLVSMLMCSKGGKPTYRGIVANTSFDARTEYTLSGNSRRRSTIFFHLLRRYCICTGLLCCSSYRIMDSVYELHAAPDVSTKTHTLKPKLDSCRGDRQCRRHRHDSGGQRSNDSKIKAAVDRQLATFRTCRSRCPTK